MVSKHRDDAPGRSGRGRGFLLLTAGALVGLLAGIGVNRLNGWPVSDGRGRNLPEPNSDSRRFTAAELLLLKDGDLNQYRPEDLNNLVAAESGITLDTVNLNRTLDDWARQLRPAAVGVAPSLTANERVAFWGEAISKLQSQLGVRIEETKGTSQQPEDVFLAVGLSTKRLTSHTLPLALHAMGHRFGRPLDLVADNDRLIARVTGQGEQAVNLVIEKNATAPRTDQELVKVHGIPVAAAQNGSDLKPLGNRELLGWFLGQRSGVYLARNETAKAEQDLLLARSVFPNSRSLFLRLMRLMDQRGPSVMGTMAWAALRGRTDPLAGISPQIPRAGGDPLSGIIPQIPRPGTDPLQMRGLPPGLPRLPGTGLPQVPEGGLP